MPKKKDKKGLLVADAGAVEKKAANPKAKAVKPENKKPANKKKAPAKPVAKVAKTPAGSKISLPENRPSLRSVYSNSMLTLLPLGFATEFKTKKCMVIFSDLANGQVHTIALSVWNRWKLQEAKKINAET